jgi:hypothetical protein
MYITHNDQIRVVSTFVVSKITIKNIVFAVKDKIRRLIYHFIAQMIFSNLKNR